MINYQIDVPFSIGDTVWVRKESEVYHTIECPFCHGKSIYDTGLRRVRHYKNSSVNEPWIIECETCKGYGTISAQVNSNVAWHKATLKGIREMHGFVPHIVYDVEYEDGSVDSAMGYNIHLKKPNK